MNSKASLRKKIFFVSLAMLMLLQASLGAFAVDFETFTNDHLIDDLDDTLNDGYDYYYGYDYDHDYDYGYVEDDSDIDSEWEEVPEPSLPELEEEENDYDYVNENENEEEIEEEEIEVEVIEIAPFATHQISAMLQSGVTRFNVAFRQGPDVSYGLIRTVNGSTNLRITGRTGEWFRVNVGGTVGFIRQNAVARTRQNAVVATNNAHIRAGRGDNFTSLTRVQRGHRVTVARRAANWSRVRANGQTGWIRNSDLHIENAMRPGRTTANNVRVHTRPRAAANIRYRLPLGANLMIVQRTTTGWSQIRIRHDGGTLHGWVRTSEIENRLHSRRLVRNGALRSGPSSNFNRTHTIPSNTSVTVRSRVGNWYRVHVNISGRRHYGWLHQNNLPRLPLGPNVGAHALQPTWGVTYGRAQMRRGAGTNHEVIRTIADNTMLNNISRRQGSWLEATYGGQTGWIHHDSIRVRTTGATIATHGGRTNAATDLRRGAGTNYGVIRQLSNNASVVVLRQSGSWLRVRAGNDEGWVRDHHVNSTTPATTSISAPLRSGPGNNYNQTRVIGSGIHVTILRHRGDWINVIADGQTGWMRALHVNIRTVTGADVSGVVNRIDSGVNTVNITGETGLRLIVPTRRTIGIGSGINMIEGIRVEHTDTNGRVTQVPITWNDASGAWRFTHSSRTFTVSFDGVLDNVTSGTYERNVVVNRGQTVVARTRQMIVVR